MGKTIAEKIFDAHLRDEPFPGAKVLNLDRVLCHEITTPVAIADLEWLRVCEDWKLQLDAARIVGVSDDPAVTSVYRRWVGDGGSAGAAPEAVWIEDHYRVVDDLDADHTIVPPGSLRRIHELYERLEQLEIELGRRAPGDLPAAFGPEPDVSSDRTDR
jgi:hypothetical protein